MAFNGSSGGATNSGSSGNGGNQDGPLNKRLCTGKENNEAGINNNRVSDLCHAIFFFGMTFSLNVSNYILQL